jgi:hypothetical protein
VVCRQTVKVDSLRVADQYSIPPTFLPSEFYQRPPPLLANRDSPAGTLRRTWSKKFSVPKSVIFATSEIWAAPESEIWCAVKSVHTYTSPWYWQLRGACRPRKDCRVKSAGVAFGFLLFSLAAAAQQYVLSTIVGAAPPATPAPGLSVAIESPQGVATDAAGNVYFGNLDSVFKLDQHGILTRVAGNFTVGYSGDGGSATSAQLSRPQGLAVDGAGNLFIADSNNHSIRKVSVSGIITTVAGNGTSGSSGDGDPATSAQLSYPQGLAVDGAGNLFIAGDNRIRKVSASGIITTVAGNGISGFSGDGGPATSAALFYPKGLAVDDAGNLFIADGPRVRKVPPAGSSPPLRATGPYAPPLPHAFRRRLEMAGRPPAYNWTLGV